MANLTVNTRKHGGKDECVYSDTDAGFSQKTCLLSPRKLRGLSRIQADGRRFCWVDCRRFCWVSSARLFGTRTLGYRRHLAAMVGIEQRRLRNNSTSPQYITGLLCNFVQYKKYRNGIYGQSKLCLLPLHLLLVPLSEILLPEYIFQASGIIIYVKGSPDNTR